MDAVNNSTGSSAIHITMEKGGSTQSKGPWKIFSLEATKAAVQEEIKRMTQLPVSSAYASHRLRVLNKIMQLISLQVQKAKFTFI